MSHRPNPATLAAAAAIVLAVALTGCQGDEPETDLPTLGDPTSEPTETPTPTPTPDEDELTTPPAFDAPTTQEEALEQAAAHVQAYQDAGAYLANADVEGEDRIEAFAEADVTDGDFNRFEEAAANNLTVEGSPTFDPDEGYAAYAETEGEAFDYGFVELPGCLDLTTMTVIRDGVEQEHGENSDFGVRYQLLYYPGQGHWVIIDAENTGESC